MQLDPKSFAADGFATVPDVVGPAIIAEILRELAELGADDAIRRGGQTYAIRNVLQHVSSIAALAVSPAVRSLVDPILGASGFPVRGILFDKISAANWHVAWHQDLSIAVNERREVPGFGPWSVKAGVPHVQPPVEILQRMVTVRVHLDDCHTLNGPLRVIPGSHKLGRLDAAGIEHCTTATEAVECLVPRGGALVMRPLLVHSSAPAQVANHRRVVHLEYAGGALRGGLVWHGAITDATAAR